MNDQVGGAAQHHGDDNNSSCRPEGTEKDHVQEPLSMKCRLHLLRGEIRGGVAIHLRVGAMADHTPGVEVSLEKSVPEQRVASHASHVATGLRELANGGYIQERKDMQVDAKLNG